MSVLEDVNVEEIKLDAERELAAARERRERLSLDALAGAEGAAEELAQVETAIGELERKIVLAGLAVAERARRVRVAREETEREERAQAAREAQAAAVARQRELNAVRAQLATLSGAVRGFLAAEAVLQDASARARIHYHSLSEAVALLSVITLRDSGLHGDDVFQFVPAGQRNRILNLFATAELEQEPAPAAGQHAQCAVCTHERLAEVEADLAAAVPLRELEARYGLSRSSLSRHKKHAAAAAAAV